MQLKEVNLNLLTALKALLEERHVSRAAGKLCLTQSAMSKNLAQLRELTGDPLLIRQGSGFDLTERGGKLLAELPALFDSLERLLRREDFTPALCKSHFTLAVTDYVAHYLLPHLISSLQGEAPGLGLTVVPWDSTLMGKLQDGSIHLATTIVDETPPWLSAKRLDEDDFVCLVRCGHGAEGGMTLESYCSFRHIALTAGGDKVLVIDEALARLGRARTIAVYMPFYEAALRTAAATDLVLTLPRHIANHAARGLNLTLLELPFKADRREYSLIWHKKYEDDPAHRWLRESLHGQMAGSLYCH